LIIEFAKQLRQLTPFSENAECGTALFHLVTGLAGSSTQEKK